MTDLLTETAVVPHLRTRWLGHAYHYFEQLPSTNTALRELARDAQVPAGTLFLTDFQSAGKGRHQRRWEAPPGTALLFSVLLRPNWPASQAGWLSMLGSLAVATAVAPLVDVAVGIKWPNDVVLAVDGAWHKVAGVLLEGDYDVNGRLQTAVLGMGINVNMPEAALPAALATSATSLLVQIGAQVSRSQLLQNLLANLEVGYEAAVAGQSPLAAWQLRLVTLGEAVQVTDLHQATTLSGTAVAVDEAGGLVVRDKNGRLHTVYAGDVTLQKGFDNPPKSV